MHGIAITLGGQRFAVEEWHDSTPWRWQTWPWVSQGRAGSHTVSHSPHPPATSNDHRRPQTRENQPIAASAGVAKGCAVSDTLAIIIGATVSAVVALAVVFVESLLSRRHERRKLAADRLAEYSASAHAALIRIGGIVRASIDGKEAARSRSMLDASDRLNNLLSSIMILDSDAVVRAAVAIDRELTRLEHAAMRQVWSRNDWLRQREELSTLVDGFQRAARNYLDAGPLTTESPRLITGALRSSGV